jgi:integrase
VATAYDHNGKRLVRYGKTRKEATAKRQALEQDIADRAPITSGHGVKTSAYLRQWLDLTLAQRVTAGRLSQSTLDSYRDNTELHIIPALGNVALDRLSPAHVREWLVALSVKPSGRPRRKLRPGEDQLPPPPALSPRTVQYCHAILRKALADAVRDELVKRNVAALAESPAVPQRAIQPPTPAEMKTLLAAAVNDRLATYWLLVLALGLRRGEGLGLAWSDIDFDAGTVRLHTSIQRTRAGKLARKRLKTDKSHATVAVPKAALDALREHRTRQAAERLAAIAWADPDLVFATRVGTPLEPRAVNREWAGLCDRAGVRRLRVHDLRHAFASYLHGAGADLKEIQAALRHSRMSTTADIYVHVFAEVKQGTAVHMDALLTALTGASLLGVVHPARAA